MAVAAAAGPAAAGQEEAGESRKLFVGGIPSGAQELELRAHFARFGEVRSVVVMRDRETGHGRGFSFVEFEDEAAVAAAVGDGDRPRHFLCGRMIVDSVIALFRVDFSGRGELAEHQQKLAQMLSRLTKIAEFNVALYITNQVIADPGGRMFITDPKKLASGHVLAHAATIRLMRGKAKASSVSA